MPSKLPHKNKLQLLQAQTRDQDAIRRIADNAAGAVGNALARVPLKSWLERRGSLKDLKAVLLHHLLAFQPVLSDASTLAYLRGRYRAVLHLEQHLRHSPRKFRLGKYDDALEFYRQKMQLTEADIAKIKAIYGKQALELLQTNADVLMDKLNGAVGDIIESGTHVKGGVSMLKDAFDAAGMSSTPWQLEAIVRREITCAYRGGAHEARQDQAMQEYVIGYEWFTAGDMRVRPSHMEFDRTRAPVDHPCWLQWDPPDGFTGWGCRCSGPIPIYDDEDPDWNIPDPIPDPLAND